MPQFHYIALNQDQKELSGVIEAPNEILARKKLNDLGLSIVALKTSETLTRPEGKTTFEFEALDKNGKKVIGTIVADSGLKAYARLFDEYQLNVTALVDAALAEVEKNKAKVQGIGMLQKAYEASFRQQKKKLTAEDTESLTLEKSRQELLEKINFTMRRVESFLQTYYSDLKTEEREVIQGYLNQLIRIKDSTNLDHIRSTCERMLQHLQNKELFLHEEQKARESATVKVETKEMLRNLKRTGLQKEINLRTSLHHWQNILWLRPLATFLLRFFKEPNPEVKKLKDEIKNANIHILAYLKILLFEKSKLLKREAFESIRTLQKEKKRLRLSIRGFTLQAQKWKTEGSFQNRRSEERLRELSGWLLAFYLLVYFFSYPLSTKVFPFSFPQNFSFYHTQLIKGLTIFFFFFYGVLTISLFWLKGKFIRSYLVYGIGLFVFLLISINLL